jgi:WASH complex subunit strumpellin
VFDLLEDVIDLMNNKLKKIPLKFNRSDLKDYAQYEERQKMAGLTHQISVFTESILAMETYLIGVIEVDPKMILEDGIRKEVIRVVCKILDKSLVFKGNVDEFEVRMRKLAEILEK